MRGILLSILLLSSCGGSASWSGSWRSAPSVPGSFVEMSLSGSGTSIAGTGVQHVEAGSDRPFVVKGTSAPVPGPGVTFSYADGAFEGFMFSQPDADHLDLSNGIRSLSFTRQ